MTFDSNAVYNQNERDTQNQMFNQTQDSRNNSHYDPNLRSTFGGTNTENDSIANYTSK